MGNFVTEDKNCSAQSSEDFYIFEFEMKRENRKFFSFLLSLFIAGAHFASLNQNESTYFFSQVFFLPFSSVAPICTRGKELSAEDPLRSEYHFPIIFPTPTRA